MLEESNVKVMYSPTLNEYFLYSRGEKLIHCLRCGPSEIAVLVPDANPEDLSSQMADLSLRYRVTSLGLPADVRNATTDAALLVVSAVRLIHQIPSAVLTMLRSKE